MKQKPPRWVQITAAVLRRYLALDMAVYAGSATLFLLTASFPLLMWVLMLVNLVPGFSVEGVAELLADFLPQIPEIQTAILGLFAKFKRPVCTVCGVAGCADDHRLGVGRYERTADRPAKADARIAPDAFEPPAGDWLHLRV